MFTDELQYPADEYFPEYDRNSRNYYVVKMTRRATERNEIIIPYITGNPKGSAYGVDNNQKVFLVIRMYINQKTKVDSLPLILSGVMQSFLQKGKNTAWVTK
ncbi:MAG: hypothetical protein GXW85_10170 [Clostridia bacterium]|nr:hypothetical protein [Clostridia bacterium]